MNVMNPFIMTALRYLQRSIRQYLDRDALPFVVWRCTFEKSEMLIEADGEPALQVTLTIRWSDVTEKEVLLTKKTIEKTKYGLIIHGVVEEEAL